MKRLFLITCALASVLSPAVTFAAAVSPSVIELSASRGEDLDSTFTILNTGASEQMYFLDLLAFEPDGEDGTPVFTSQEASQNEFLSWINFPVREISVPATSKVDVPFQVVVPDDVVSGSYYGAITVSSAPTDVVASNGAIVEAKTAILVFMTVEGETVEKLELLDFMFEQTDSTLPFGTFRYRLQNQGNVHLSPMGEIILTGPLGQTIVKLDANESQGRVLPSSTRTYEVTLNPGDMSWIDRAGYQLRHLMFGPLTAELALTYGQSKTVTSQTTIQMIPVELLSLLAVSVMLFALLLRKQKKQ